MLAESNFLGYQDHQNTCLAVYSQIMITSHTSQEGLGLLAGGPRELAQEQFHTLIPIFQ